MAKMKVKVPTSEILFYVGSQKDGHVSVSHLNRSLVLAQELAGLGQEVGFLIKNDKLAKRAIKRLGFAVDMVDNPNPAYEAALMVHSRSQVVVFDGIDLGVRIPAALNNTNKKLVVLDDTGNKRLDVDVVINGTYAGGRYRYGRGVKETRYFLGSKYCILGPEYDDFPVRKTAATVKTLLVSLGSSDPTGMTCRVADALKDAPLPFEIIYVLGPGFNKFQELEAALNQHRSRFYFVQNPDSLAPLLVTAQLAIVSGGRACYEAARVGTPSIVIPTTGHQELVTSALGEKLAAFPLPFAWRMPQNVFQNRLLDLLDLTSSNKKYRDRAVLEAFKLVDSQGRQRAAQIIYSCLSTQRTHEALA